MNHGALGKCNSSEISSFPFTYPLLSKGVMAWTDPTTPDIKSYASLLALSIPNMTSFIFNPSATFRHTTIQGVDIGLWEVNATETLVLATSTKYSPTSIAIANLGLSSSEINVRQLLDTGTKFDSGAKNISFEPVGSGAFVLRIVTEGERWWIDLREWVGNWGLFICFQECAQTISKTYK